MAIEREILKDIQSYKPKFIGPFTLRNLAGIGLSLAIGLPTFFFLNQYFIKTFSFFISALLATPICACGFCEIYGLPLEKFIYTVIKTFLFSPRQRKFKINNYYEQLFLELHEPHDYKKKIKRNKTVESDFTY